MCAWSVVVAHAASPHEPGKIGFRDMGSGLDSVDEDEVRELPLVTCDTCKNSGPGDPSTWHHWRHKFKGNWQKPNGGETGTVTVAPGLAMPFDPVLRQALVDKGILTAQDLEEAEHKIRMISGMGVSHGRGIGDQATPEEDSGVNPFSQQRSRESGKPA